MALTSFVFLIICLSVSFIGSIQTKEPELTEFGKKVKKDMSEDTYKNMFAVKGKTDDELKEAVKKSSKKFAELVPFPYHEAAEEKVEKENQELGIANLNSSVLFHCQTFAISEGFTKLHRINSTNIDDLAQKYADAFEKVAKTLDKDDLTSIFIAIVTAVADFLKSVGVTSEDSVKKIIQAYNEEMKKYLSNADLLGSIL
nr:uncharacterized protein LOC107454432 [Parasteatoda tepidariorum]